MNRNEDLQPLPYHGYVAIKWSEDGLNRDLALARRCSTTEATRISYIISCLFFVRLNTVGINNDTHFQSCYQADTVGKMAELTGVEPDLLRDGRQFITPQPISKITPF